jgi:hypothetical protein
LALNAEGNVSGLDTKAPRAPSGPAGAGRSTTRRRRSRNFQATQAGIGWPPRRQSGSPQTF